MGEIVVAGHIMVRRAAYQFGTFLPPGPLGHVDCGLGSALGLAPWALVAPTDTVAETGQELTLSGIRVVFQNTPDAEAPAEMNFHFPDRRVLCMAENCTHTLHNLHPSGEPRRATPWPGASTSRKPSTCGPMTRTPCSPATTGPASAPTT